MSKRKNRSKAPNIPLETLERARRQAAGEDVDSEVAEAPAEEASAPRAKSKPLPSVSAPRQRRRKQSVEEMTHEEIEELLMNPTKTVSEDELHQQYGYVLADLRNMWILAAVLFIILIALATIIV